MNAELTKEEAMLAPGLGGRTKVSLPPDMDRRAANSNRDCKFRSQAARSGAEEVPTRACIQSAGNLVLKSQTRENIAKNK